jgi:hypothetical protein
MIVFDEGSIDDRQMTFPKLQEEVEKSSNVFPGSSEISL